MINILAVSDVRLDSLIGILQERAPFFRKTLDLIISCGDVRPSYIEVLSSTLNKMVYYVEGNHHEYIPKKRPEKTDLMFNASNNTIPGGINLHRTYYESEEYRLTGFEGSRWYNGEGKQYQEKEMAENVSHVMRKMAFAKFSDIFLKRQAPPLITVSHASILGVGDGDDNVHKGFESFNAFLIKEKPSLWLYGHTHLRHYSERVSYVKNNCAFINCYGYKFISIDEREIYFSFSPDEIWDESGNLIRGPRTLISHTN